MKYSIAIFVLTCGFASASEEPQRIRELVRRLGDDTFRGREAAAKELKSIGYAAFPALIAGTQDGDPERSMRCRKLLPHSEWWKNAKLLSFVLNLKEPASSEFRGWHRFVGLVGDSSEARELYIEMHQTRGNELATIDEEPDLLEQIHSHSREQILTRTGAKRHFKFDGESFKERGNVTFFFFLAVHPYWDQTTRVRPDCTPLAGGRLEGDLRDSPPLKTLFSAWLDRERDWQYRRLGIDLAAKADLPKTGPMLTALIASARTSEHHFQCAMLISSLRYRPLSQIRPILEPMIENSTVVSQAPTTRVTIGDVALGVLVLASDKNLQAFGFKPEGTSTPLGDFRFENSTARDAAVAKWKSR